MDGQLPEDTGVLTDSRLHTGKAEKLAPGRRNETEAGKYMKGGNTPRTTTGCLQSKRMFKLNYPHLRCASLESRSTSETLRLTVTYTEA